MFRNNRDKKKDYTKIEEKLADCFLSFGLSKINKKQTN